MTIHLATSDPTQTTELPATVAGLATAITMAHAAALEVISRVDPAQSTELGEVAEHFAEAADTLYCGSGSKLPRAKAGTPSAARAVAATRPLGAIATDCIELAVELLGNEDEPLTPLEVLAITRAVTALCAARSSVQGCSE